MKSPEANQSVQHHLASLARTSHAAQAACEAVVPKLHNESVLKVIHELMAIHAQELSHLSSTVGDASLGLAAVVDSAKAAAQALIKSLSHEADVVQTLVTPHERLLSELNDVLTQGGLPPARLTTAREHKSQIERHVKSLKEHIDTLRSDKEQSRRQEDGQEIQRGRAMPRTDAKAPRINNSSDY